MLRKIVFILVVLALVAIAVFIVAAAENGVLLGIGILLLATLIYIFTSRSHIVRGRLFFIGFFLALTAIIALALLALPIQAD
ncbi:MAG: hypothetical protein B6243_07895 [Anaerolineaceae bacterium 4572_5.2]|nr:MAG: hypothetical protein B6243_07895 [Anaerolineaceae bacterium 4572_5.2]